MNFAAVIPHWLDAFLIAPFRWPGTDYAGMWLGSALIAFYCTVVGEYFAAGLYFLHRRYYSGMEDNMVRYHNLSVDALHAGNKEAYLAANKLAQEDFGKSFFAQATIGFASLWPVPFALGWMSLRFEGIVLYTIPGTELHAGYVFVLLSLYIAIRILFARYAKRVLPPFPRIAALKRKAKEARGVMKSLLRTPSAEELAAAKQRAPQEG